MAEPELIVGSDITDAGAVGLQLLTGATSPASVSQILGLTAAATGAHFTGLTDTNSRTQTACTAVRGILTVFVNLGWVAPEGTAAATAAEEQQE